MMMMCRPTKRIRRRTIVYVRVGIRNQLLRIHLRRRFGSLHNANSSTQKDNADTVFDLTTVDGDAIEAREAQRCACDCRSVDHVVNYLFVKRHEQRHEQMSHRRRRRAGEQRVDPFCLFLPSCVAITDFYSVVISSLA